LGRRQVGGRWGFGVEGDFVGIVSRWLCGRKGLDRLYAGNTGGYEIIL